MSHAPSSARGQLRPGVRPRAHLAEAGSGMKRLSSQWGGGASEGYLLTAAWRVPAGSVRGEGSRCRRSRRQRAGRAASREFQTHKLPGSESLEAMRQSNLTLQGETEARGHSATSRAGTERRASPERLTVHFEVELGFQVRPRGWSARALAQQQGRGLLGQAAPARILHHPALYHRRARRDGRPQGCGEGRG